MFIMRKIKVVIPTRYSLGMALTLLGAVVNFSASTADAEFRIELRKSYFVGTELSSSPLPNMYVPPNTTAYTVRYPLIDSATGLPAQRFFMGPRATQEEWVLVNDRGWKWVSPLDVVAANTFLLAHPEVAVTVLPSTPTGRYSTQTIKVASLPYGASYFANRFGSVRIAGTLRAVESATGSTATGYTLRLRTPIGLASRPAAGSQVIISHVHSRAPQAGPYIKRADPHNLHSAFGTLAYTPAGTFHLRIHRPTSSNPLYDSATCEACNNTELSFGYTSGTASLRGGNYQRVQRNGQLVSVYGSNLAHANYITGSCTTGNPFFGARSFLISGIAPWLPIAPFYQAVPDFPVVINSHAPVYQ